MSASDLRAVSKLPVPTAELQARTDAVREFISNAITQAGGSLDFAEFMELALYAPGIGYYVNGLPKLGAGGDFVTAPELGDLFARALAKQVAQILDTLDNGIILEFGAGSGVLAAQLLRALDELDQLPEQYQILELSSDLQTRQREAVNKLPDYLARRVCWLTSLPEKPLNAVIVANEVLDAMPAVRFLVKDEGCYRQRVGLHNGQFVWQVADVSDQQLDALKNNYQLGVGYQSEQNQRAEAWVASVSECLLSGALLLIDYGYNGREYYHPQRAEGTLRCHYQQFAHNDPLVLAGIQDITSHVDFTAIAEAGHAAGLQVSGFTNLSGFILSSGILEELQSRPRGAEQQLAISNELKRLTLPTEMGEIFKVIALGRNVDVDLICFQLQDSRGRL
ncbi:MAG: SAM-dependent MidA family methyltransferase [Gammaproteobacteria bacterium]|jgi:SAM-dependent MidA family methyltransferase